MIDVSTEKLLTLDQAAEILQVAKATVTAWINRGTHGIRLEAMKFGAHWRTSEEAIQRFGDRQTPSFNVDSSHVLHQRKLKSAERVHERAMKKLEYELGDRKSATCKYEIDIGHVTIPRDTKLYYPACIVYYRLAVITVKLPRLSERSTDIPILADGLLKQINTEFRKQEPGYKHKSLSSDAVAFIRKFTWPGNVRQLQNALTQAAVMTDRDVIHKADLAAAVSESPTASSQYMDRPLGDGFNLAEHLDSVHRHYIQLALEASGGVKSKARKLLGIPSDQTFAAQLKRLKLLD